jgi:AraC-like DNA-binding protein
MYRDKPIYEYTLQEIRIALENKDWHTIARVIDYLFAHFTFKPLLLELLSKFFGVDLKKYLPRK